jgi:cytochrome P450
MLAEISRFESPFQLAERKGGSSEPARTINGITIPEGEMVILVYGSANRDDDPAALFGANPDDLDLNRTIGFGGNNLVFGEGIHRCMGAGIAPVVAQVTLDTLINKMPNLKLHGTQPPQRLPNPYFRSFVSLPLSPGP